MLLMLAATAVLAAQPAAEARSPYLDAVRQYGTGTERQAIAALLALRLDGPDRVIAELDDRVCASLGARDCTPGRMKAAPDDNGARIRATWRRLYPRALALHIEALAACDPVTHPSAITLHRGVVRRLIVRMGEIGRRPDGVPALASLAKTGRHLLIWTLQLVDDQPGLQSVLDGFDAGRSADAELRLAVADLEARRAMADAVEAAIERRDFVTYTQHETMLRQEESRVLARAARFYEGVLAIDGGSIEAQIRLARVLARLGKLDAAAARLRALPAPIGNPRQAYLSALFLADVEERLGRNPEAIAQYEAAARAWPGAQTPVLGMARLRALAGASSAARAALATLTADGPLRDAVRSDPWHGFDSGQSWRLPDAIAALQASFEPL
jgi:tetratricopeptide (TPR) repeat protein